MKSSQWTRGFLLITLIGFFSFSASVLAQDHFVVPEQVSGQLPAESTIIHEYDSRVLVRADADALDASVRRHASQLEDTGYLSYRAWRGPVAGHEPENLPDLDDSYILLALAGPMDRQWQAEIAASGLTIVDHVNPYGVLVRGDSDTVFQASRQIQTSHGYPVITHALELPEASRTYRDFNEWMIGMRGLSDLGIRTEDGKGIIRLVFHNDADFSQTHGQINNILQTGPEFSSVHNHAQYLASADDLAAVLDDIPEIAFAHGVFPRELHNNIGAQEHLTNIEPVWSDLGYAGSGIIAGVNDNGLYLDHDDFPDGSVVATVGAMENTDSGHGTHVAGTVAGRGAADSPENTHECGDVTTPLPDARGMAWESQLAHNNIFDGGVTEESAMMQWQSEQGAVINNNSWGYAGFGAPSTGYDGETVVVDAAVRDADSSTNVNEQMSIVFSAGNFGTSGVSKPGNAKNVITVGASQNDRCGSYIPSQCDGPDIGDMACFSSHGPSQGRIKPDIVAPGTDVLSTQSGDPAATWGGWEQPFWTGDDYEILPGTSMSAPMVTGAATIFYQYYQDVYGQLPSPALVKAALINNATDLGMDFPSNIQGWGRLDLRRTLEGPVEDGIVYYDQDDVDHLETGESWTTEIGVAGDDDPLKISLVWTDPPGASGCDPCHINDLDLVVTAPDGTVYRGNQFDGAWSEPDATGRDELNNVENVFIDSPMSGEWTVEINAFNVAENPSNLDGQDFALVATGDFGGISIEPPSAEVCRADDSFDYTVVLSGQFEGTTDLSFDNLPSGATGDFDPNPVVFPDEESTFTVGSLTAVDGGTYEIDISAVDDSDPDNFADGTAQLVLYEDNPGMVDLLSPGDGSIDVDLQPEFSWDVPVEAAEYQFQLDTSDGFGSPLIDEVLDGTSLTPDDELATGTDFFWRVRAINACGEGDWSDTFEFQTRFEPVADIGPESFSFELTLGESDSDILEISNIGTGNLVWDIETDSIDAGSAGGRFDGDFHPDNWELVNDPSGVGGFVDIEDGPPVEVYVTGGDDGVGGDTDFQIEIPTDGTITFDWGYQSTDTACWDSGGYAINGDYTELACNDAEVPYFDETETVEVSQGDLFAFRVNTQDGNFGPGVLGVTNFEFSPDVCDDPQDVPWLNASPESGSTPAGDTDDVTVTVDATGLNADDYEAYLCVSTNAEGAAMIPVLVEMTVFDDDAGAIAGNVMSEGYCSDDPFPAAGASISVEGSSGSVFTTTADGDGNYSININEDESPADVTFSADGHLSVTVEDVTVTAGETTEVDADLLLDSPCATVDPDEFSETISAGSAEDYDLELGNVNGASDLDWEVEMAESDCASADGVDWLSPSAGSGTVAAGGSDILVLTADSDGLADGEYEALVCISTNDEQVETIEVPFSLTVVDPSLGFLEGTVTSQGVCGEDPGPLQGAQVTVTGADSTYETETDENGEYSFEISEQESPVDIVVTGENLAEQSETGVVIEAGETTTVDFDLEGDVACIDVDPTELSAIIATGESEDHTFDIGNFGAQTLDWMIDTGAGVTRDESTPLIGFNFTTAAAGPADPQNWTRISSADGTVTNAPDDTGEATDVSFSWGGVTTDGPLFLGTDTLAGDAVPQHDYDLSGMTGYGFRSDGDFFIEVSGLEPNSAYEYWFVAYRATSNIDNDVRVSEGDELDAIEFKQFLDSDDNEGHFVINDVKGSDDQIWDELSFITESDSDGNITIHWEGDTQTTVIGAFAIRSALTCDIPDWLSVDPDSGSIGVGGTDDTVTATLDAAGLEPGDYAASICVESNDPTNPVVPVSVDMQVVPSADVGWVEGEVSSQGYCSDDPSLVEGALVTVTSQDDTYTTTTDENGFYQVIISENESPVDIEVEAPDHTPGIETGVIIEGGETTTVDFDLVLEAPCATVDPDSISQVISDGGTATRDLDIGNVDGAADLDWSVFTAEVEIADPRAHFPAMPYQVEAHGDRDSVSALMDESGAVSQGGTGPVPFGGFDVPVFTTTGWDAPGYITLDALGDGSYTLIEENQPTSVFAAHFFANDFSVHYGLATDGGDLPQDMLIEIDPDTGDFDEIGTVSGGPGATWTSMKYDHTTGTVFATTPDALYEIDVNALEATLVGPIEGDGVNPEPVVISMAISPEGVMYAIDIVDDVLLAIDKTSGEASVIGSLGVAPSFAQDMDFDQTDGTLYWGGYFGGGNSQLMTIDTDTGTATSLADVDGGSELLSFSIALPGAASCMEAEDIPWLSLSPESGTIEAGATDTVEVLMDAAGLSEGTYNADICVETNDANNSLVVVPVELMVQTEDVATVEGTVMSQGYCGDDPSAAAGAGILIQGESGATFGGSADGDGFYQVEVPTEESPVSVTAIASGHLSATTDEIDLVDGQAVTVDFDLVLEAPCATVTPDEIGFTLPSSGQDSETLTIGNVDGGATLTWNLETGNGCYDPELDTWLTLTGDLNLPEGGPSGNAVPAGTSQDVIATASASGLEPGTYETVLCILTNDTEQETFNVPVSLDVLPDTIFEDRFEAEMPE